MIIYSDRAVIGKYMETSSSFFIFILEQGQLKDNGFGQKVTSDRWASCRSVKIEGT